MKPVYQRLFYERDGKGDCMRCAVASIFELEYEDVPAFEDMREDGNWWQVYNEFVNSLGFEVLHVVVPENARPVPLCMYIASGRSPRGVLHSVIYQGDKMIHDPHPSGLGIERVEEYERFIAIDPAKQ